ncbi:MAG: histidine kinase [Paenibacillus sp.]|jgi:predicted ATPase/signal transduction histidine kinase|nr:histidine kinase [Paenibacillus sp.]
MFQLLGYQVVEKIGSNETISIYRVLRTKDNARYIAKTTNDSSAGTETAAFQYEYEGLLQLKGKGVLEPVSLETAADRPVLLFRDPGGTTLAHLLHTRRASLKLPALLEAAIALADCIRELHHEQMRINELTPFHFMISDDLTKAKFIDIRSCSTDSRSFSRVTRRAASVLPYLSPEQTGRTGMVPDYRSDYYSLGILLYEWFTGSLPFQSPDALDIVYHHIATTPEPVYLKNKSIPKMVSDIVAKCMEKMPDARYISAYGIRSDLQECLVQLRVTGKVQRFPLANHDVSYTWDKLEGLFNRRIEQQMLVQAVQRVSESNSAEIVWVSGQAGLGKTSLIMETIRTVVPAHGYFVSGQCQAASDGNLAPYRVWGQVIDQLVSHLLTVGALQLEEWKRHLVEALQGDGRLLIEMVPRFALLIGEQPVVATVSEADRRRKRHAAMNRFFQVFWRRDQLLVLFLDDLQDCDEASLRYAADLMSDPATERLLLVGAYRDNELSAQHPLRTLMERLETNTHVQTIHLSAYGHAELKRSIARLLQGSIEGIDELVDVLLLKTEGNPLYLKHTLQALLDRKMIAFDEQERIWNWNIRSIADLSVHESLAASLSESVGLLPDREAYILGRAAFLGKQFHLPILSIITGVPGQQAAEWARKAARQRLIQPSYGEPDSYRFQHDQIWQRAYEAVPGQERMKLHGEIGWLLAARMTDHADVRLDEVLYHLNQAAAHITVPAEKRKLAELNLQAGLQAKAALELEASLDYLHRAADALDEPCWQEDYPLIYQVYREWVEAEFQSGHLDNAAGLFELLLDKVNSDSDRAQVYMLMIQMELNRENHKEVIRLGEKTLQLLGIPFSTAPGYPQLLRQLMRVRWKLRKHPVERFDACPPMTDERRKAAMSVFVYTAHATFESNKKGWLHSILTMLEMTLEYGLTPEASEGFAGYALLQHYYFNRYEDAYKWARLACSVAKDNPRLYAQAYNVFSLCYRSWRKYEPQLLLQFEGDNQKPALQWSDLGHFNMSMLINCGLLFHFSYPLPYIYNQLLAHSAQLRKQNNPTYWQLAAVTADLLVTLIGQKSPNDPFERIDPDAGLLTGEAVRTAEKDMIRTATTSRFVTGYIMGDYRKARAALASTAIEESAHHYYTVLVLKQFYPGSSRQEQAKLMQQIRKSLRRLKRLSRKSADLYEHKYLLAAAEAASMGNRHSRAETLYEQALESARAGRYTHDEAIISECFAKYGISRDKPMLAKMYMNQAYESYLKWGALAKTAELEARYGHLLPRKPAPETNLEQIDYRSVMMSAQALSGEMEMDRLLHMLMRIMIRNAGAEYGALLFHDEEQWKVEAYGTIDKLNIESVPLSEADNLVPTAIISYTARTRETLVLHDVASSEMFERSEYVKNNGLKSVLCLPIMHQNKLVCLLYLDNNLSTGVFTESRQDVLKLLSSQGAISIANAKLYSGMQHLKNNLEDQVVERTRDLEKSMQATSEALAEMTVYAERTRIAQEIHDIVGHTLTSTILQIEAGKRLLHKDMDSATTRLGEAQDLVRHSLNEIRNSVHMLKEDKYYDIEAALQLLIEDTERNTGVRIHAVIDPISHISFMHKKVIYHALQEGLTNGIRHGRADAFSFSLRDEGSQLLFRLADNGAGGGEIEMGFGLKMMRDRVRQLRGILDIDTEPGKGCMLRINFPYGV